MGAVPYTGTVVSFIRGDVTLDKQVLLGDAVAILEYLFRGATPPACLDRADVNDDGAVDLSDPIYILIYRLAGGNPPPAPFPSSGNDRTKDDLICN